MTENFDFLLKTTPAEMAVMLLESVLQELNRTLKDYGSLPTV